MRDPRKKKHRDLRRIALSAHRPSIFSLFDIYHPEYKKYDNISDWQIHWNAQWAWINRIVGGDLPGCGVPAWYRRAHNSQLRTRQKAALHKAFREDDWDGLSLPRGRRDIGWLWC